MILRLSKRFYDVVRDGATQTLLMEFAACRRRADLSYREGWSSDYSSNALVFGSAFHGCLEYIYNHWKKEETPSRVWLQMVATKELEKHAENVRKERHWTFEDQEAVSLNAGYLSVLLPGYFKKYWPDDFGKLWVKNECVFKNRYADKVSFTGKYDRVAMNKHGEHWIYETKTKSRIEPALQDRLSFDFQSNFYILNFLLETNIFATGFVYDVIQRPALRMGKNEQLKGFIQRVRDAVTPEYFQRITVTRTRQEFNEWVQKDLEPLVTEFLQWNSGDIPTYRNPSACETRYGACKFIKVCGLNRYYGLHKRKILYPELVEGA